MIAELAVPGPDNLEAQDFLTAKQNMLDQLKEICYRPKTG